MDVEAIRVNEAVKVPFHIKEPIDPRDYKLVHLETIYTVKNSVTLAKLKKAHSQENCIKMWKPFEIANRHTHKTH